MFPPIPLEWATDDNYDAGADPWAGNPTKVSPSAQTKAKGFSPENPASAQQINYLLNTFASIANAMTNALLGRWSSVQLFPATVQSTGSTSCVYWSTPWFNKRNRAWYQPCINGSGADLYRSRNYTDWKAVTSGVGDTFALGDVNNNEDSANYGDMLVGSESYGSTIRKFNYNTNTWSDVSITATNTPIQIKHDAANATWIILEVIFGGGGAIACKTCPDTTYVMTTRTLAGSPTCTAGSGRDPYLVISDTGIAVFQSTASTFNVSTNGGSTWTLVTPSIMPKTEHSLVWVPGTQEFLFYGTDDKIYSSSNGTSWAVKATATPFGAASAGGFINSMAALGSVVWCTWYTVSGHGGLGYSADGGETWSFSGPASTIDTAGVSGARGKLVAMLRKSLVI